MKSINLPLLSLFLLLSLIAKAQQEPSNLIDLLLKKQVITQQEADSLRRKNGANNSQGLFSLNSSRLLQISGFTQVRYQAFEQASKPGGFDIRRARIDIRGDITPAWEYHFQEEFGGLAPRLADGYMTFKPWYFLKITA